MSQSDIERLLRQWFVRAMLLTFLVGAGLGAFIGYAVAR